MYLNREVIRAKRKELQQLNMDMKLLKEKLASIKEHTFVSGGTNEQKHIALDDVFKCAYEFMAKRESNELFK
jgi:hypothetical protein